MIKKCHGCGADISALLEKLADTTHANNKIVALIICCSMLEVINSLILYQIIKKKACITINSVV